MAASDKSRPDSQDKLIELLFHSGDNPHGADIACPHSQWMGYDLGQCPGVGEWKCMLQEYREPEEYGGWSTDYRACRQSDFTACPTYQKHHDEKQEPSV